MEKFIYKNRDGVEILFQEINADTVKMTGYGNLLRIGENGVSELEKKNNLFREKDISWISVPGNPFIACGFDISDFLMSHADFLKQSKRKIITKIKVEGPETFFTYVEKPVPSHPDNKKKDAKTDPSQQRN